MLAHRGLGERRPRDVTQSRVGRATRAARACDRVSLHRYFERRDASSCDARPALGISITTRGFGTRGPCRIGLVGHDGRSLSEATSRGTSDGKGLVRTCPSRPRLHESLCDGLLQ